MTVDPLQPLIDALRLVWPQADPSNLSIMADQLLRGQSTTMGTSTASLTFGQDNNFSHATVTIGNIVGGNMTSTNLTINFPQPINPQAASLQHLLYHHESATIFANRLESFVGREAEISAIRQRIAQVMPTGGYVTITAHAGEGKSSVIAWMVSQDGPDQTAFHFIALTPGREYQLSLLRPLVARLILKHGLSTTYFPDTSYPAMRDYFHSVLRQLNERGVQEVIYIDGLDQLETEVGSTRDLSFLPTSPPPGIVLVLGTRPDDTLQPLEGKKVQVEYRLPHLRYQDFQQLLVERRVVTEAAQRLYTALQGNAFYLALVVQELKAGPIADLDAFVERISDNPENLFGLTIERLQRDEDQWEKVLEPVLSLLLVAQESLDRATIRILLEVSDVRLRRGLGQLGGLVAQDANGRYFLYHLKVRDYLAEDLAQPDKAFVVSQGQIVAWHKLLAQWCVRDAQDIERMWEDITGLEQTRRWYARHHYVTHLALGQQWNMLNQVIDDGAYGRHKRRFDPSTQLYALDLDRARDASVAIDDLSRLWRWSLLRVSLTSQMDTWPDELFLALVHLGRASEALSRAELLSDPARKSDLLGMLAPFFDGATAQHVWDRAQAAAAAITDASERAKALYTLVQALATAQRWTDAQTTAASITGASERAKALYTLVQALATAQRWTDAQTTAAAIIDAGERAKALSALAQAQIQAQHSDAAATVALATIAASSITWNWASTEALRDLVQALAIAQRWTEARTTAAAITGASERARALSTLAQALAHAQRWDDARATATAITEDGPRADALSALAQALATAQHPDAAATFTLAATTAATITQNWARTNALSALALAMATAGHWTEAQSTVAAITDDSMRARALSALAQALATAQHPDAAATFARAATATAAITDDYGRASALGALALTMSSAQHPDAAATFTLAATTAATITQDWARTNALSALALAMATAQRWADAQATIAAMTDVLTRARALRDLVQIVATAGHWTEARTMAVAITDDGERVRALSALAQAMATAQHPDAAATVALATTTAAAIPDYEARVSALCNLILVMVKAQHPDAAAAVALAATTAAAIRDDEARASALRYLAQTQDVAQHWIDAATIPDDEERARTLHTLSGSLYVTVNTPVMRYHVATTWRNIKTRTTLLAVSNIAQSLYTDPTLWSEMVEAFAWVDDHLRDG